jgi:hypothetical protein
MSAQPAQQLVGRWEQMTVLLQVLLPFLASCGEYLLLQLLAAPAVAGIAIASFALVQVRLWVGACMCCTGHIQPGWIHVTSSSKQSRCGQAGRHFLGCKLM